MELPTTARREADPWRGVAGDAGEQGGYLAAMITYRVRLSFPLLLPLTTVLGTDYRHQARRAATGGVPALQSDRRLGRRGHRPQSCADPAEGPGVSVADDLGNAFTATWRRRSGCTVHGTEPRRSWPRRFPCPLTHGDRPHRAAGVTVSRLCGSPSPHDLDGGPQPLRYFPRCGYPVFD